MTGLWLVRHAKVANPEGLIYGSSDVAASMPAPEVIGAVARMLPDDAVWIASPLSRAADTMAALRAAAGSDHGDTLIEPGVEPGLAEQDFGDWEGKPSAEIWGAVAQELRDDPASIVPPNGESFHQLCRRAGEALERLMHTHAGSNIIVVAHSGTIRAALAGALDLTPGAALRIAVDVLSVSRCDHFPDSGAWRVQFINRVAQVKP